MRLQMKFTISRRFVISAVVFSHADFADYANYIVLPHPIPADCSLKRTADFRRKKFLLQTSFILNLIVSYYFFLDKKVTKKSSAETSSNRAFRAGPCCKP